VSLDTTQYVRINTGLNPLILQANRDAVRIAVSSLKPAKSNTSFHLLGGDDAPLPMLSIDTNVWALAMSDTSSLIITETDPIKTALHDGLGNPISSLGGAIDAHMADVHHHIINKYVHQHTTIETTLSTATIGDGSEYEIDVADTTGFAVGDYIHINTTSTESTHPVITAIIPGAPGSFTLDRRLDKAHSIGDSITKSIVDMALSGQVGTMATPQEYAAWPEPGEVWHITRLLFSMTHGSAGDLGLFGNLTALTNGMLIRVKINGQYGTLTNWKSNSDIKIDMFDVEFDNRSGGQGSFGTSGRGTFLKTGATLELNGDTGDRFEVYIQDDITALGFFGMKIQGHLAGV
jgi:hypothetical protein